MRLLGAAMLSVAAATPAAAQRPDSLRGDSTHPVQLETIIVRAPLPLARVPQAVGMLDSLELRRGRPTLGLDEAAADLPGVYIASRGNFALDQRISIRGFGSRSAFGTRGVTVLLDGVPQTNPDGQSQLTNIDVGDLDRLEVLRGSASLLYGNGAGGVLSLESTPAAPSPVAARVRAVTGAFGLLKWQGWGSARHGPLSGTLAVSRATLDGYRQQSSADLRRLAVTGEYLSARTRVRLQVLAADDPEARNPGALTAAEYAVNPDSAAARNLSNNAGKAVTQQQAAVTVTRFGGHGDRYDATVYGLLRDLDNPLAANVDVRIRRRMGGVRLTGVRPMGSAARAPTLTAGLDAQWLRDDRGNFTPGHGPPADTALLQLEYVTSLGPFARVTWAPGGRWLLQGGVRYDAVGFRVVDRDLADGSDDSGNRTLGSWSGSGGASFSVADLLIPYVNISTSYETPTTAELAVQQGGAGGFNPALGPQRAVTFEFGGRGRRARFDWSAALFESRIKDAIVPFTQSDGRSYYANAGRLRNRGVELGAGWRPVPAVRLDAAWTLADYRFTDYALVSGGSTTVLDGRRLAGVPRSFVHLGLRAALGSGWIAADQTVSSSLFGDDANTLPVAGWARTDLRVGWSGGWSGTRLSPFAGIRNLWNARYIGSVTINGAGGRVLEPAPGRNAFLGLEAAW